MNNTEYETTQQAAVRLGVTSRAIQKWAAAGKLPGAVKHGKSWLIPKNATVSEEVRVGDQMIPNRVANVYQITPFRVAMPLMNSPYPIGKAMEYIEALSDPDDRNIALGEYYFFSGQSEKAANVMAEYQNSPDPSLRFSSNLVAVFSNLAGGHTHLTRFAMKNLQEQVRSGLNTNAPTEFHAIGIFTATTASVLLHLPIPEIPPLEEYLRYLPGGLKLYGCYILAHKAYLEGDYSRALTTADMGIAISPKVYPIAFVYCHIIAAIALMNMKRPKEAMARLEKAWEIAEPDGLIEPFGEHHGLMQGLIENFFKEKYPELHKKIDKITYTFSAGWRKVHNPDTNHEVADNLSTLEFTIAMLYSRDWTATEIGDHLGLSERTVYNRIDGIYSKLGISNKKQLDQYMLK
ncbi:MAG: helix-turn-helix domain-containing protein [Firmicutes bacterium]|nr:helix-turn-helix domain-containing protein [Bacillota bacterium]